MNFWYGEVMLIQELGKIRTKEDERQEVLRLTANLFDEWNEKLEVMGHICDHYDYMWRFFEDGRVVIHDRLDYDLNDNLSGCEWQGRTYTGHFEYESLDELLIDWLDELEKNEGMYDFTEDIEYIKSLKEIINT